MEKKICMVIVRYGLEVNGGAELQCRQLAERMAQRYSEIHVLTTKAVDYLTWEDAYTNEYEIINGVHVHRFSVEHPRVLDEFHPINRRVLDGALAVEEEEEWLEKQGPYVPDLIRYISAHKDDYDVFIFFIYLYYPTVIGLPIVENKAILIPEAHDEPHLRMKLFEDVFTKPKAIMFNTDEERLVVHKGFNNENIPNQIGGVGVEIPSEIDERRFKEKYSIEKYIIYVGRVDIDKNCGVLFDYFAEYKKRNPSDLKLLLVGKVSMEVPEHPDIVCLGFVDEMDKFAGIAGAEILVVPSGLESLSIVILEAMSVHTSVMVNGQCDVLRGHCIKSNGAFYYNNYFEFEGQINYLLTHPIERKEMIDNAYRYVQDNYQWNIILDRLDKLIEQVGCANDRDGDNI